MELRDYLRHWGVVGAAGFGREGIVFGVLVTSSGDTHNRRSQGSCAMGDCQC